MRNRSHRSQVALLLLILVSTAVALPVIPSAEAGGPDWAAQVQAMDEALVRHDAATAQATWRDAYAAAHASREWPGMIAVGDAAIRLGRATDTVAVAESRARRVYLTALMRARRHGSLDGVLAAGEAFGRLGDREVVQQALAVATDMARRSGDDLAQRRVQAFRSQWVARPLT